MGSRVQTLAAQNAKRKTQRFETQFKTQVQNAALYEEKRKQNTVSNLKISQNAGFETQMRKRRIWNAKRKHKIQNVSKKQMP